MGSTFTSRATTWAIGIGVVAGLQSPLAYAKPSCALLLANAHMINYRDLNFIPGWVVGDDAAGAALMQKYVDLAADAAARGIDPAESYSTFLDRWGLDVHQIVSTQGFGKFTEEQNREAAYITAKAPVEKLILQRFAKSPTVTVHAEDNNILAALRMLEKNNAVSANTLENLKILRERILNMDTTAELLRDRSSLKGRAEYVTAEFLKQRGKQFRKTILQLPDNQKLSFIVPEVKIEERVETVTDPVTGVSAPVTTRHFVYGAAIKSFGKSDITAYDTYFRRALAAGQEAENAQSSRAEYTQRYLFDRALAERLKGIVNDTEHPVRFTARRNRPLTPEEIANETLFKEQVQDIEAILNHESDIHPDVTSLAQVAKGGRFTARLGVLTGGVATAGSFIWGGIQMYEKSKQNYDKAAQQKEQLEDALNKTNEQYWIEKCKKYDTVEKTIGCLKKFAGILVNSLLNDHEVRQKALEADHLKGLRLEEKIADIAVERQKFLDSFDRVSNGTLGKEGGFRVWAEVVTGMIMTFAQQRGYNEVANPAAVAAEVQKKTADISLTPKDPINAGKKIDSWSKEEIKAQMDAIDDDVRKLNLGYQMSVKANAQLPRAGVDADILHAMALKDVNARLYYLMEIDPDDKALSTRITTLAKANDVAIETIRKSITDKFPTTSAEAIAALQEQGKREALAAAEAEAKAKAAAEAKAEEDRAKAEEEADLKELERNAAERKKRPRSGTKPKASLTPSRDTADARNR